MASEQEVKLKFLASITNNPHQRLHDLVGELGVSYGTLFKWRKEYLDAKLAGDISTCVNVDELIIARAADSVRDDLITLHPESKTAIEGSIVQEVTAVTTGLSALQLLDTRLTTAGLGLAARIATMSNRHDLEPRDLLTLASALSNLQTAFFTKGTNVNVLNVNAAEGSEGLSKFKELLNA